MAEDETLWMARLLETSLQESGLSGREVERRLGWRRGTLDRLLQGEASLSHEQVLEILDVLNCGAAQAVGHRPRTPGSSMVDDLVDRFHRLGYETDTPPLSLEPPSTKGQLERHVESIFREAFGLEPEEEAEDEDA